MRRLMSVLFALVFTISLISCGDDKKETAGNTVVVNNNAGVSMADGLDLKAVGELVKTTKNAEELEQKLNETGGINNLDLNEDGNVDYINVQEYGEGNVRGFSLTTNLSKDDVQEIATIEVEKNGDQANVQLSGNQNVYGSNSHYNSSFTFGDYLMFRYMYSPHSYYYHAPYYHGYYPGYYNSYRPVPYSTYNSRVTRSYSTSTTTYKKSTTPRKSTVKSPNANKTSSTVKNRSLSESKSTKKDLKARDKTKDNRGGGFGKSNKTTTSPKKTATPKKTSSSTYKKKSGSSTSGSSYRSSSSRSSSTSRSSGGGFRKSDANFKENIIVLPNALEMLEGLNGYTYNWKVNEFPNEGFTDKTQIGLLAQEMEGVSPNFVRTRTDGYKEVDYAALTPVLLQAIKEQQATINNLNAKVKVLEEKVK